MDRLPVELLELICDHCKFEDWGSLRASCKSFEPATTHRLFAEHIMGFFLTDLRKFDELANTPHVAKHVKNFIIHGDILPQFPSEAAWEEIIDLRPPFSRYLENYERQHRPGGRPDQCHPYSYERATTRHHLRAEAQEQYKALPFHALTAAELSSSYEAYNRYSKEQHDWDERADLLFREAFSKLPNLSSAEIETYSFADNNTRTPWRQLISKILVGPDNWMMANSTEADDEWDLEERKPELENPIYNKALRCLLNAIGNRSKKTPLKHIDRLLIKSTAGQSLFHEPPLSLSSLGSVMGSISDVAPVRPSSSDGFEHVKRLGLKALHQLAVEEDELVVTNTKLWHIAQLTEDLRAILSRAQNLTALDLRLEDSEYVTDPMMFHPGSATPELQDLFGRLLPLQFPSLHSLAISCTTTKQNMVAFLKSVGGTVKELAVKDCELLPGGTWTAVIQQFPEILPAADSIYLEGLRDETVDPGDEALFEDSVGCKRVRNLEEDPFLNLEHDKAMEDFLFHGGIMPSLSSDDFWQDWHYMDAAVDDAMDEEQDTAASFFL